MTTIELNATSPGCSAPRFGPTWTTSAGDEADVLRMIKALVAQLPEPA